MHQPCEVQLGILSIKRLGWSTETFIMQFAHCGNSLISALLCSLLWSAKKLIVWAPRGLDLIICGAHVGKCNSSCPS